MSNKDVKTVYKGTGLCSFGVGANLAEIDVKDGKVIRTRPARYDKAYDMEQFRPWTIKARGSEFSASNKSLIPPHAVGYKKRITSPNRILYPLKREDWDPNGERNLQNRGKSKFVRISWDEATDIIASEIKRIEEKYGLYSILLQCDGHGETKVVHAAHGCNTRLFDVLGGYTMQARQPDSWEGWYWGAKHVWGQDPVGQADMGNLLLDIAENTDTLVFWGCDMETTPWGWGGQMPSRYCNWLTEIGVKQVYICPDVNYGAAAHNDKWVPVFPNTDAALHLAIMYTWLAEDTWNKDYINTHSVGFEYLQKYILGEDDDKTPKTPKWAEPICGVPARTIKALARNWAKKAFSIAHCNGGSLIRSTYSHEPGRLEVCLMAMQGMGAPGRNIIKFIEWNFYGLDTQQPPPKSEVVPTLDKAYRGYNFVQPASFIPKTLIPKAILGDYTEDNPLAWHGFTLAGWPRWDQFIEYHYPVAGAKELHMIWTDTPCWTTCWNGGNTMIEALHSEKIETVIAQHPWLENDCLYADLILPINTKYEETDIGVDVVGGSYSTIYYEEQAIPPCGESKSDWEAVGEVAKKLGVYDAYVGGKTEEEWIRHGFETSGVQDYISYEEFKKNGYYLAPTAENWEEVPRGFESFYKDPEENALNTPTGKLEIYSQALADNFPDDEERGPYPKFIPYGDRHQESLLHPRSEKFPYLIVSNHPKWRVHANMDDISWFREIETCKVTGPDGYQYEPVWINPKDAIELGVAHGDIVKIYNDRGWTMGGVYVTERILPGVVLQDHGARLDPIEDGVSDRSGANNLICPTETTSKNAPGECTSGFLVAVEKVDVFAMAKQYPEAFGRKYDKGIGVSIENRVKL